jgi:outer membrane protein assembly factor BamD
MRFLTVLSIILISLSGCSKFSRIQKSKDYDVKLKAADAYYAKQQYHYAQQLYEELFPLLKGDPKFEDLYYKYAYCAYHQKDWMNAENLFKSFVEVFPNSNHATEMDYMRAYCYYKQSPKYELDQTNTTKTIGLMQTFISMHPNSEKNKEAMEIIDKCRLKLELKDLGGAQLYYDMGQFRAAAIAFVTLIGNYPDSPKSDLYKLQAIKSYYGYAENSVDTKKEERFKQVITECNDFTDRFPGSEFTKQVEDYLKLSQNNIKALQQNEQVKTAA